ncbi:MAG: protein-arginine deiminase [Myxococcales bacterium]|nr:protein-arginine deiminase [Myxococcales bacterium]
MTGSTDGTDGASDATDATDGTADATDGSSDSTDSADATDGSDASDGTPGEPVIDLRADVNRDGAVDLTGPSDEVGEDGWNETGGAIVLANIDDDQTRCDNTVNDVDLPKCHDATDEVVNGALDLDDLARLHVLPWNGASATATARIELDPPDAGRVFIHVRPDLELGWEALGVAQEGIVSGKNANLSTGIELAIEAKDIVRDTSTWDGKIKVTLIVDDEGKELGRDSVVVRVAPIVTYHHMLPAETIYATKLNGSDSEDFRNDLAAAIAESDSKPKFKGVLYSDQWTQDFFETGYMSMPTSDGQQHVIRVNYRSANVYDNGDNPLREAGRFAFDLRGVDSAAIQEYDTGSDPQMDSLNSFGNTETIPPYSHDGKDYPLGRLFRGRVNTFYPDPRFSKMMESQLVQPPVYVDTSWLIVGHVDESMTFLPTSKAQRGWTVGVSDAVMAKQMFEGLVEDGHGEVIVFDNQKWSSFPPKSAEITISKLLADQDIAEASAEAVVYIDEQIDVLLAETGVTRDELVPFAGLHEKQGGYSVAYQPGTVNGLLIDASVFAPPKTHGPIIDGVDPFTRQIEEALTEIGMAVHFVEDWDLYHRLLGEVHCGSNAMRATPSARWWETGR